MAVDNERWTKVANVFDELIELAPAERRARLEALRRDDRELADEVDRMLRADEATSGLLDARLEDVVVMAEPQADLVDRTGQSVDEYRLVERIGRGGMGEVYLAEREAG